MNLEDKPSSEAESALAALNRLFAGELWDAKTKSAFEALSEIRRAQSSKKKLEIVRERFRNWQEESVVAIRKYFPQYIALAEAHPELIQGDLWHWVEDNVWDKLRSLCGARNPNRIFQVIESKRPEDSVDRRMVWWFAVACNGNPSINDPPAPEKPWFAPSWLLQENVRPGTSRRVSDGLREKVRGTEYLLQCYSSDLSLRFFTVIDEELMNARVASAITGRRKPEKALAVSPRIIEEQGLEREAVIAKVQNPSRHTVLTTPEVALYFEVQPRTIFRWKEEGKLQNGVKRGTITIASVRKLQRNRSKGHPTRKDV